MGTLQEVHQNNKARYDQGEFSGAIKRDKKVLALQRDNKTWVLAQILEIRAKPEPNSEDEEEEECEIEQEKLKSSIANPENPDVVMKNDNDEEKKGDDSDDNIKYANQPVQYYVNYMREARRNDRWVEENMVRIDDETVEQLHAEFEQANQIEEEEKKN